MLNAAETGLTDYTVPESRQYKNDGYPVRAQAGEKVSITPRGESGDGNLYVSVHLNEKTLVEAVSRNIRSGKISINDRQIGRSPWGRR